MTYAALNLAVLAIVAIACAVLRALTPRAGRPRLHTMSIAALMSLGMTAIGDNVMIAVGLVGYDPARYSGVLIGVAPIEDFAYSLAVAFFAPTLWCFLAARKVAA